MFRAKQLASLFQCVTSKGLRLRRKEVPTMFTHPAWECESCGKMTKQGGRGSSCANTGAFACNRGKCCESSYNYGPDAECTVLHRSLTCSISPSCRWLWLMSLSVLTSSSTPASVSGRPMLVMEQHRLPQSAYLQTGVKGKMGVEHRRR